MKPKFILTEGICYKIINFYFNYIINNKIQTEADEANLNKKRSKKTLQKYVERRKTAKVDAKLEDFFAAGRVYARLSSSPGQCGRADGYVLEGKELEFYLKRIK